MYNVGRLIGSMVGIVGSIHVLGWILERGRRAFERPKRDVAVENNHEISSIEDISKKVDWLVAKEMYDMRRLNPVSHSDRYDV